MFLFSKIKNFWLSFKKKNLPSKSQWKSFFKILTKRERMLFLASLAIAIISGISLCSVVYFKNTIVVGKFGGAYTEGLVGRPRFINPLYAVTSDTDRDLTELVYSGLMKYNGQNQLAPDIAKNYEIKDEGLTYDFILKDNVYWHDGAKLTADDVIFTIKTVQAGEYKSPLRASWFGVETQKINDYAVRFMLKAPYPAFLEVATLKILPEHIWKNIPAETFPFSIYNLNPVGSGPYKFKSLVQDKIGNIQTITLAANKKYYGKIPSISKIYFKFFASEEELANQILKKNLEGAAISSSASLKISQKAYQEYDLSLPRYFAVFFNPDKSDILANKNIRQALNYSTDKKEIIDNVLRGKGKPVDSPILPENYGIQAPEKIYEFNLDKANFLLDKAGWQEKDDNGMRVKIAKKEIAFQLKSDLKPGSNNSEVKALQKCLAKLGFFQDSEANGNFGEQTKAAVIAFQEKYASEILAPAGLEKGVGTVLKSTRNKLNSLCFQNASEITPLKITLVTVNQSALLQIAETLKTQWKKAGVEVKIISADASEVENEFIKPRAYEALLFGEALNSLPDPYPFWHSSQKKDPGLNLALYENKKADELLTDARKTIDAKTRAEKLNAFQNILIDAAPAVFLYNPDYIYWVSPKIKGIKTETISDPSKRFADIENWYIKTKRAWSRRTI